MSEPMSDTLEEVELILQGPTESIWHALQRHHSKLKAARAEIELLREEATENARIIGKSGSREAAKDAEIERLEGKLASTEYGGYASRIKFLEAKLSSLRASVGGEKWIEVKEGCDMPTHDQKVLTYSEDMGCRIIPFGTSVKGLPPHVTHWQPLPAPPSLPEKE